jgi:hypothetical protein
VRHKVRHKVPLLQALHFSDIHNHNLYDCSALLWTFFFLFELPSVISPACWVWTLSAIMNTSSETQWNVENGHDDGDSGDSGDDYNDGDEFDIQPAPTIMYEWSEGVVSSDDTDAESDTSTHGFDVTPNHITSSSIKHLLMDEDGHAEMDEYEHEQQEQREQGPRNKKRTMSGNGSGSGNKRANKTRKPSSSADSGKSRASRSERGTVCLKDKVVNVTSVSKLVHLLKRSSNVLVLLTIPRMPASALTEFAMDHVARHLHPSNADKNNVPITLAKIDSVKHRGELKQCEYLFASASAFEELIVKAPLCCFKRNKSDPPIVAPLVNPQGLDESDVLAMCAALFDDASLAPLDNTLDVLMANPTPEYLFFYSELDPIVPRFHNSLPEPRKMIDVREGNTYMMQWFLDHSDVASRGLAMSLIKMDRPDLKLATVFDVKEKKEYAFRHLSQWLLKQASDASKANEASKASD